MQLNLSKRQKKDFVEWAKRATAGIDSSSCMMGILNQPTETAKLEFALQIGHCLLAGKPLLLVVEEGTQLPPKLQAAATAIEYFQPNHEESFKDALRRAHARVGIFPEH